MATARTQAPRRRVPARQRREQMVAVALEMARQEGVGSLTLARVAEASGVSKPIAYQHFATMPGLLQAMYERIDAQYEETITTQLTAHAGSGGEPEITLRELCRAYVACSLETGALHDEIGAALVVEGDGRSQRAAIADQYVGLLSTAFDLEAGHAYRVAVAFLGAADRVCEAVIAGRIRQVDAVETLTALFAPQLTGRPRSHHA